MRIYSDFQQRHFDYDSQTIEEGHPVPLIIPASSKDVLTYFEVTKCQNFAEEEEMSPVSGHLVPTLAPEGDELLYDLPLPMPTPSPAKRSSMRITESFEFIEKPPSASCIIVLNVVRGC